MFGKILCDFSLKISADRAGIVAQGEFPKSHGDRARFQGDHKLFRPIEESEWKSQLEQLTRHLGRWKYIPPKEIN